jgi:hypothetical protein
MLLSLTVVSYPLKYIQMNKLNLFAVVLASIALQNCGKTYDPGSVAGGNYTIASAMASLALQPKTVTLDAGTGGSFRGNSGTRYVFQPSSFRTASGTIVTGNVEVQVTEFLNKTDMLFSGVLPICNGEALLSGGEIEVHAKQGGQELQMAPGATFKANMPMKGTDPAGMELFTGIRDNGVVIWKPVDTGFGTGIFTAGDTIGISSSTMNFANADRFMTNPDYQNFTITVNAGGKNFSDDSITINSFYDDYNGVWPLGFGHVSGTPNHVYTENHVPNIPVHFVVFAVIKGNFYGGILGATPVTGANYTVNLTLTTPVAFKAEVAKL